jgi:hypothetical protein
MINFLNTYAVLYKASGEVKEVTPANGEAFTLLELNELVKGYVEHVPLVGTGRKLPNRSLYCNEEGKMVGLEINKEATKIFSLYYGDNIDVIVGDVLICTNTMVK